MHLCLASRTATAAQFGEAAVADLEPRWVRCVSALQAAGSDATLLLLDDPMSMAAFQQDAFAGASAEAVRRAIRTAWQSLARAGERIDSVLLFGGDEIFPCFRLPNPVFDRRLDPDPQVLSDNPYGAIDDSLDEWLAPSIPIGRICDGGSAATFAQVLDRVIANRVARPAREGSCAIINEQWIDASLPAVSALDPPIDRRIAPAYAVSSANADDLRRRVIYVNLHGFDGDPAWKSYDVVADRFLDVLTPDSFAADPIGGSLIVSEACYGAQIAGRTADDSCALRAQAEGAAAVIGATGLVFGSILQPWLQVDDADRLAQILLGVMTPGVEIGALLVRARKEFVAQCRGESGIVNPYEQKTALQFILLGDPSLPVM